MAEVAVSALKTLVNFWIQVSPHSIFLRRVRYKVEELQVEFRRLQSLLKDADQKQHGSVTNRNSIQEIRSFAYRAEDVLEEYVVKVGSAKGEGFTNILKILLCFANEIGTLHNLGSEIERIKSKITILTGHMNQSGIQVLITRDQEELEHFIGMDEDIKKIVSLLVSDQEIPHRVIGVWGMGGSGKTTVSQMVYKHVDVRRYFDSFAWVCITQKCQIQSVIQEIFRQLLPAERKKDTSDIDELVEKIYSVQMEKKCLIVLDDIWKLDDWECLSQCFPNVGSHSKVLLTTRIGKIAEIGYPIKLKCLTEDEAWKLLRMEAFAKIDFQGMDEDIEKLVSLLVSDQESRQYQVIGVWGTGGSGKTTVSKKVYKHVEVRRFFHSFAWVCITQKCQIQSVMQDILRQLLPAERKKDTNDIDELVEQINKVQMEKKCLIVLDDIWKLDDWKCLSKCFPNVGSHSKVLLTSRHGNVAEIGYPIKLKGFTEDEAWKLLRMKAFANDFQEPWDDSEYEKLGRKMILKCECLPLAVSVIGGILRGKHSLHEWKLASDDVNSSYIGRGEGTEVQGEVEKLLVLSYDELPYHLKPCFISLGFLREDERVSVERIYDMWTAQGFIQSRHVGISETMRDVAKYYLYELQFRCMVQFDDLGTLSLRDSMLNLCRSKAEEERFLKVVHVDGDDNDSDVLKAVENITPLRSVQITRKSFDLTNPLIFNLPQFKSLRILIVHSCGLRGKCVHGIENLIHLRLLGLRECKWERFSLESVDKLSFLQTLDLTDTTLMKLPPVDTFCKMRQLRHLYLPFFPDYVRIKGKLRLMNLSELETLYNFHSKFYDWKDLISLHKLRSLQRCWVNDDESLVQITDYICGSNLRWIDISIKNCNLIETYALRSLLMTRDATLELQIESCILFKLPRLAISSFPKMCPGLVDFDLGDADIAEDIMPALDMFPNLKKLRLRYIRFGWKEMVCGAGSFRRLEELYFYRVNGKFEWRIDEDAMPNLSSMQIVLCSGINFMIPERLRLFAEIASCS